MFTVCSVLMSGKCRCLQPLISQCFCKRHCTSRMWSSWSASSSVSNISTVTCWTRVQPSTYLHKTLSDQKQAHKFHQSWSRSDYIDVMFHQQDAGSEQRHVVFLNLKGENVPQGFSSRHTKKLLLKSQDNFIRLY